MNRLEDGIGTYRLCGQANGQGQKGPDARARASAVEKTWSGYFELVRVGQRFRQVILHGRRPVRPGQYDPKSPHAPPLLPPPPRPRADDGGLAAGSQRLRDAALPSVTCRARLGLPRGKKSSPVERVIGRARAIIGALSTHHPPVGTAARRVVPLKDCGRPLKMLGPYTSLVQIGRSGRNWRIADTTACPSLKQLSLIVHGPEWRLCNKTFERDPS